MIYPSLLANSFDMKKFILLLLAVVLGTAAMQGETTKQSENKSEWSEVQKVEIPAGTSIQEGVTKSGNPKYWIELGDLKVSVSNGSAEKFKAGEVKLELVKWQSSKTGGFKYSTRQVKGSAKAKSIDLDITKLFK